MEFHRYYPTGLGQSRCGVLGCGRGPTDEVHIAGLNQASTGTELVRCPTCRRDVPTDFTVRTFLKRRHGSVQMRLCRDCASDPAAGRAAAKLALTERTTSERLASLMGQLDRGEIDQDTYDREAAKLL